jgi:hypothetical protein
MKIGAATNTTSQYRNHDKAAFTADQARASGQQQPAYPWYKLRAAQGQGQGHDPAQPQSRPRVNLNPNLDHIRFGMLPQYPAHEIPNDVLEAFERARQNPPGGAARTFTHFRQTLRNFWGG